jgi:ABC-type glycerol-3-phosphate transport system permease component
MATLFILGFIGCWMDFVTPAVLLKDANLFSMTAATRMVHDVDASDFQLLTAWCMLNIVPVLFMFMLVQRYLVSGLTAGALK